MKYMKILIIGTPGSGKTTFSRALANKTGLKHYELSKYIIENKLGKQRKDHFSFDHMTVRDAIINLRGILDTHCNDIITEPDIVILIKCDIKQLKTVYKIRNYSDRKIRENIDYDLFDEAEDAFPIDLKFHRNEISLDEMVEKAQCFINKYTKNHK